MPRYGWGGYELLNAVGWEQGDWNGDGLFNRSDLVLALQDGGYEQGPRQGAAVVPEPASWLLMLVSSFCLATKHRRARPKLQI